MINKYTELLPGLNSILFHKKIYIFYYLTNKLFRIVKVIDNTKTYLNLIIAKAIYNHQQQKVCTASDYNS